jgi:hypothetical protein
MRVEEYRVYLTGPALEVSDTIKIERMISKAVQCALIQTDGTPGIWVESVEFGQVNREK